MLAPRFHRDEDGVECTAFARERVFNLRRHHAEVLAFNEFERGERLEFAAEHPRQPLRLARPPKIGGGVVRDRAFAAKMADTARALAARLHLHWRGKARR